MQPPDSCCTNLTKASSRSLPEWLCARAYSNAAAKASKAMRFANSMCFSSDSWRRGRAVLPRCLKRCLLATLKGGPDSVPSSSGLFGWMVQAVVAP